MRPVLVGLDTGGNGPEPLSPDNMSGRRLADLAGLTRDEFIERFDRVNLLPGDVDTQAAVANLMPILRGRRVVTLGREVSMALGVRGDLSWGVGAGFIGAHLPHPSGLNRWWNDRSNVEVAGRFMRDLLRPCIHVEGPDGSGKSTLVDSLEVIMNLDRRPTQNPPRDWPDCLGRIIDRIAPGIVCDRSSGLVSELVYGPVIRGGTCTPEDRIWGVVASLAHAVTFVYCRPAANLIVPTWREGEDPDHVAKVQLKATNLIERYDEVMARVSSIGARVIRYDRDTMRPEEIARCVGW